ncbi:WD40 repeat-like protein [Conidiobolus coronatus NRRL 28638]|uniref:WD40 repeat-like protein n=1 Tax=Conidiobolus coronatus (strain ATCC 28846 / CBS 209.66 / NRRL 28638) TaxID=796925 RepID=A0A137P4Z6_CONC2|nr:WD40 repeat-like protein [Conidiobolus coronatus NRRL 28638]|eukprot:KXN70092.1 WD40 repeat-like protein [Conidiobolus coronatus NRRL 28638]
MKLSTMKFDSNDLNCYLYRYLLESGFQHSAFAFHHESKLEEFEDKKQAIAPGALVSLIQQGLLYQKLQEQMDNDNLPEISISNNNSNNNNTYEDKVDKGPVNKKPKLKAIPKSPSSNNNQQQNLITNLNKKEKSKLSSEVSSGGNKEKKIRKENSNSELVIKSGGKSDYNNQELEPKKVKQSSILSLNSLVLSGHQAEVFVCAWNPSNPFCVASGSGDSTVRIWNLSTNSLQSENYIVLNHQPSSNENKDVTTLDWNSSGTCLATGSYDGQARIWTNSGDLKFVLDKHTGPIFSLKWNKKENLLITASADNTIIVWDTTNGEMKYQLKNHTAAAMDLDWLDNSTFASCSSDKSIYVYKVGSSKPIKTFLGHTSEVNTIKWDPTKKLLASCSDDFTAKIWDMESDSPIVNLVGHDKEIYTIAWSPINNENSNNSSRSILATASFDCTSRLWDATTGECLHKLQGHTEPVYSIAFSPDAKYIASASWDHTLHIWSVEDGSIVKTYKGNSGIFEVDWSPTGELIAACLSDYTVVILDLKKSSSIN